MNDPVLYESHSHTPLCNHAVGEPGEYAAAAQQRGLKGLLVTCHNPMPQGFSPHVRMREAQFDQYVDLVAEARQQWAGRVDVRLGLEADFYEGYEPYLQQQLDRAEFHFVLGSVHPHIQEFRRDYWHDDPLEVQRRYFQLLAKAAESGLFDSLAHPDLIKNMFADVWDEKLILSDIQYALDRIADTGVAMELNTSGINKTIAEMNPFPEMLRQMQIRGIPVTLGADAHQPERVADGYATAMELLTQCGYKHVNFFLDRKRHPVLIEDAMASLVDPSAVD